MSTLSGAQRTNKKESNKNSEFLPYTTDLSGGREEKGGKKKERESESAPLARGCSIAIFQMRENRKGIYFISREIPAE